jgi:hypothetical protein
LNRYATRPKKPSCGVDEGAIADRLNPARSTPTEQPRAAPEQVRERGSGPIDAVIAPVAEIAQDASSTRSLREKSD